MLSDPYDVETLIAAGKTCSALLQTKAFAKYVKAPLHPAAMPKTDDEWAQFTRAGAAPVFHPVGTCKMGVDDLAVVSPDLKVRGVENLRVIDASIMPQIISGNTNAACIMFGHKGAEMILRDEV